MKIKRFENFFNDGVKRGIIKRVKVVLALVFCYFMISLLPKLSDHPGKTENSDYFENFFLSEEYLPLFYSEYYNIKYFGIEKLHPFDSSKYERVFQDLVNKEVIKDHQIFRPPRPDDDFLKSFHSEKYLQSLKSSFNLLKIIELKSVLFFPWRITHRKVLIPMLHQTGGTILAAKSALKRGWAINLGGGFHHASKNSGSGFCAYADIAMAIQTLFKTEKEVKNILYIDLDVHQGNGPETDFFHDKRVFIFDIYNKYIFPRDNLAKKRIDRRVELGFHVRDTVYLTKLKEGLEEVLSNFKFDLIIYNAGTDILEGDPLGNWSITEGGVIKRDEIVFKNAFKFNTPIVMLLSGGYQKKTARVISNSIKNLFEKFFNKLSP